MQKLELRRDFKLSEYLIELEYVTQDISETIN